MRSAARNSCPVIGSVEQRASTSPLADVRYSGRPTLRSGKAISIMKFAVCSISSTASLKPPSEILGTLAVAALPSGFARRSSILFVSLAIDGSGVKFAKDHTDQFALRAAERRDDIFHAVVDVEFRRQDRDQAVCDIEQLAVGGTPGHRRSVEDHNVVAASRTRLRDRLADSVACLGIGSPDRRQQRDSVRGLDRAGSLGTDAEPAEAA